MTEAAAPDSQPSTDYTAAASRFLTSDLGTSGILVLLPDGNFIFHNHGHCIKLDSLPKNAAEFDAAILEAAQDLDAPS